MSPQGHEEEEEAAAAAGSQFQRQLPTKAADRPAAPKRASGKHTHAKRAPCRRRKQKGRNARLAGARRTTTHGRIAPRHARTTGTSSPPHDVQRTSSQPRPERAGGAQAGFRFRAAGPRPGPRRPHLPATGQRGLVGLGRLERPTSRLSGVRSNQLSYRPERHPAGPTPGARARRTQTASRGPGSNGCVRRDVQTAAGDFYPSRSVKIAHGPTCMPGACTRRRGPREVVERADDSKCRRRRLHGVPLERR